MIFYVRIRPIFDPSAAIGKHCCGAGREAVAMNRLQRASSNRSSEAIVSARTQ
jgi:hypothetical protein